jgi:hypothetical protein
VVFGAFVSVTITALSEPLSAPVEAALYLPQGLKRQWDVVSFDPRGVEQSNPIRCSPALVPPAMAGPSNSIDRLQRQNACTNRRQFGAIRTEPGNPRLRRTAWWGWEDSNF